MGSSCCAPEKPDYKNGSPPVKGDVTPCFANGRLFHIIKGKRWYFYNDTQDEKMTIILDFGAGSKVEAYDKAVMTNLQESGSCTVTLELLPLETEKCAVVSKSIGFASKFSSNTFSAAEKAQFRLAARKKVDTELQAMRALMSQNKRIKSANQLLKASRSASKMFVDVYFPPTDNSLVRTGVDKIPIGVLSDLSMFCWQRPEDYLPTRWRKQLTLYSSITPNDIDQGSLGDCYFLCSVSALAEYKAHITNMFSNDHCCLIRRSEKKYGAWRVTFNIGGWWRQYIIDSYLPSTSLLPSFARNRKHPNELWPSLTEKAYAKAYGSYQSLVAGFPWQALEDLTGYPAFCFDDLWVKARSDEHSQDRLFELLNDWSEKNYLISISTPNKVVKDYFSRSGLATGHAYTVLEVKHFPLHRFCLLKIRNPWGNGVEWTGDWSDDSKLWETYPLVKLACRPEKKKDGVFWMEWKDVVQHFDSGCVCYRRGHWYSTWHDYRVAGKFERLDYPTVALEIIVQKTSLTAYFSLHQKDRRGLLPEDPDNRYAAIMLSISKGALDTAGQTIVANSSSNPDEPSSDYVFQTTRSVGLKYKLEAKTRYFVIPRRMQSSSGNNTENKTFVLSMLSSEKASGKVKVNIVRIKVDSGVFRNMSGFPAEGLTSVKTVYQVKHGNSLFETKKGSCFDKGSNVKRSEYENVI